MGEKIDLHVGGYHLTEAIGAGGMGSVFRVAFKGNQMTKSTLVAVAVAVLCGAALAGEPQRHAVVIGINDYADPAIPALKYAESDAKSIYDTLTDPAIGNFPKANVKLILGKEATNDAIKEALASLRGVDKDDLVVVFYSGHGAKSGDEAFWVTQQAKAKMLDATALPNSDINKLLAKIPAQRLVVLLDCCYAASTVKKSLENPAKLFGDFPGKGRATIAGAAENQEALEFPDKKSGVFTYYLVQGLRGAADANGDGVVTFEELWTYLGENVRKASIKQGGLHEPVIITEGTTPQFLLTFNPLARAAADESVKILRKLFDDQKITGAHYDAGRKALTEAAIDALSRERRKAFADLAAGRLAPEYLGKVLAEIKDSAPPPPPTTKPGEKPTLAIVPFTVLGDVNVKDAGAILASRLLPLFAEKYDLIDQAQLKAFLDQDDLTLADLTEAVKTKGQTKSLSKAVKLRGVRLLVVGEISGAPDGLFITARLSDWQTGRMEDTRIAQVGGEDWKELVSRLSTLAEKLTVTPVTEAPATVREKTLTLDMGNKITMRLALVPPGKFMMGSPKDEKDRSDDEGPQHEVSITKAFYMAIYEVTQEQYEQVMGKNPSSFKGAQNPVETVSWGDVVDFCKRLSQKTGKTVTLPTEAQWEYACRAGSKTRFGYGVDNDYTTLGDYAWYSKNSDGKTHAVGQKKPNDWGLYDMHGNVWEWCADWYADSYVNANMTDPTGAVSGLGHVPRGGCWSLLPRYCRSAFRGGFDPDYRSSILRFRVVMELK